MLITIAKTFKMLKSLVILFIKKYISNVSKNKTNSYTLIRNTGIIKAAKWHLRTLHKFSTRALYKFNRLYFAILVTQKFTKAFYNLLLLHKNKQMIKKKFEKQILFFSKTCYNHPSDCNLRRKNS